MAASAPGPTRADRNGGITDSDSHAMITPPPQLEVNARCKHMCLIEVCPRPEEAKRQITVHPKKREKNGGKYMVGFWSQLEVHPRPGKRPSVQAGVFVLGGVRDVHFFRSNL